MCWEEGVVAIGGVVEVTGTNGRAMPSHIFYSRGRNQKRGRLQIMGGGPFFRPRKSFNGGKRRLLGFSFQGLTCQIFSDFVDESGVISLTQREVPMSWRGFEPGLARYVLRRHLPNWWGFEQGTTHYALRRHLPGFKDGIHDFCHTRWMQYFRLWDVICK